MFEYTASTSVSTIPTGVLVANGVLNGEVDLVSVDIIEHTMARVRVDSTFEESHHQDYSERRRIKEAR